MVLGIIIGYLIGGTSTAAYIIWFILQLKKQGFIKVESTKKLTTSSEHPPTELRPAKEIYSEAQSKVLNDGNQSLTNIAIEAIEQSRKELFYYISVEADQEDNSDLSAVDFLDKMERRFMF